MKKRIIIVIGCGTLIAVLLSSYLWLNNNDIFAFGCVVYDVFNISCPTCGFTRMILSILRGDFLSAFHDNAFMFVTLPFWAYVIIKFLYHYIRCGKLVNSTNVNFSILLAIGIGVLFSIFRNI